jgi:hypothetical protein
MARMCEETSGANRAKRRFRGLPRFREWMDDRRLVARATCKGCRLREVDVQDR